MVERTIASVCMAAVFLAFDSWRVRKLEPKAKWLYGLLLLLVAYHGVDFILQARLPKFYDVTGHLLIGPAKAIVARLTVPQ
ncbi:MAG: hypothetical protein J7639_22470 [Paenibacillaceae bacterium]|nr:hypothetical protein [Paenibacillaceae bacterium]